MATEDEVLSQAWLEREPTIEGTKVLEKMRDLRLSRIERGRLKNARLHSLAWNFKSPDGHNAKIELLQPINDKIHHQTGHIAIKKFFEQPEEIYISGRMYGEGLSKTGVDLVIKAADISPREDMLITLLDAADNYQFGNTNASIYR